VTWTALAFCAGIFFGGFVWSAAAVEYRRRWREAIRLIQRLEDEMARGPRKLPNVNAARLEAMRRKYKEPLA
jgi:hypothetical protein